MKTDLSWTGFPRSFYRERRKAWNPYPRWVGRRIEYAARLATERWRELAQANKYDSIDKVTFKLAVLDKVWEINLEHRATGDKLKNYTEWRSLADKFVDSAFELANLTVPASARFSLTEEKEMRVFVSAMASFGFRSWVDSHGTMPNDVLPRVSNFDFTQLGEYDPGPPPSGPRGRIMLSWMENGERKQTPLYSDDEDEGDDDDGAGRTNPADPMGRVGTQITYDVCRGRVAVALGVILSPVMLLLWSTVRDLLPSTSDRARAYGFGIVALLIAEACAESFDKKRPSTCVRDKFREWDEWWLGVPPRPERTPYDEPVDRFKELPDEKPEMVIRSYADGAFTLHF